MNRNAHIYNHNVLAGMLEELTDGTYVFTYTKEYLERDTARPVSLTLPLQTSPFISQRMFPFFDGLIPEGWLLDIAAKNWKISVDDRMGLLINVCIDCIGSVHVVPIVQEDT